MGLTHFRRTRLRSLNLDTFDVSLTICSLVDFTLDTIAIVAKARSNDTIAMAGSTAMLSAGVYRGASCCSSRCRTTCCQTDTGELSENMSLFLRTLLNLCAQLRSHSLGSVSRNVLPASGVIAIVY